MDDQNETAWLWLSACVDSVEEQRICLENVLLLNPNNAKARRGLDALSGQSGSTSQSASQPSSPPPTPPAYAGNNTSADSEWNSYGNSTNSVDWARGSAPAYGSGKQVDQPTAAELDSWVANLPVERPVSPKSGAPSPSSPPAAKPAFDGDFDFDALPDPFSAPPPPSNSAPSRGGVRGRSGSAGGSTPKSGVYGLPDVPDDYGSSPSLPAADNADSFDFSGPFSSRAEPDSLAASAPPAAPSETKRDMEFDFDSDYGRPINRAADKRRQASSAFGNYGEDDFGAANLDSRGFAQTGSDPFGGAVLPSARPSDATEPEGTTSGERFRFGASSGDRRAEIPNSSALFREDSAKSAAAEGIEEFENAGIFGGGRAATGRSDASGVLSGITASSGTHRSIPADIQVKPTFTRRHLAILGLLLLLNVASILFLILFNLRNLGL
jgi:hypothetical protein